ncbi:MAG: hypothetical protein Fur0034_21050 [Desulfuromonadia bacterium]
MGPLAVHEPDAAVTLHGDPRRSTPGKVIEKCPIQKESRRLDRIGTGGMETFEFEIRNPAFPGTNRMGDETFPSIVQFRNHRQVHVGRDDQPGCE